MADPVEALTSVIIANDNGCVASGLVITLTFALSRFNEKKTWIFVINRDYFVSKFIYIMCTICTRKIH